MRPLEDPPRILRRLGMADFLMRKHPKAKVGLISTMEDEVIRLFFSVGL